MVRFIIADFHPVVGDKHQKKHKLIKLKGKKPTLAKLRSARLKVEQILCVTLKPPLNSIGAKGI